MNYTGEHLFPGQLGHFLLVLSIVASLVATIAYFRAVKAKAPEIETGWKKMARIAYLVNAICVLSVFLIIYYIISHHYF